MRDQKNIERHHQLVNELSASYEFGHRNSSILLFVTYHSTSVVFVWCGATFEFCLIHWSVEDLEAITNLTNLKMAVKTLQKGNQINRKLKDYTTSIKVKQQGMQALDVTMPGNCKNENE